MANNLLPSAVARITEYTVSCLPTSSVNYHSWSVKVAWRDGDRFAVLHAGQCLDRNGKWSYEPTSSERTDEWLEAHQFDVDTALNLAAWAAPLIKVDGKTTVDVLEWEARHP